MNSLIAGCIKECRVKMQQWLFCSPPGKIEPYQDNIIN